MHISVVLDAQVAAIDHVIIFGIQMAVKFQTWRYTEGMITGHELAMFERSMHGLVPALVRIAGIVLIGLTIIYSVWMQPKLAGRFAVGYSNMRLRLGLKDKVWWFNPETGRTEHLTIPSSYRTFSSVSDAKRAGAFTNVSAMSDQQREYLDLSAGILYQPYIFGGFLAQAIKAYLVVFLIYFMWTGDAAWMHSTLLW